MPDIPQKDKYRLAIPHCYNNKTGVVPIFDANRPLQLRDLVRKNTFSCNLIEEEIEARNDGIVYRFRPAELARMLPRPFWANNPFELPPIFAEDGIKISPEAVEEVNWTNISWFTNPHVLRKSCLTPIQEVFEEEEELRPCFTIEPTNQDTSVKPHKVQEEPRSLPLPSRIIKGK